MLVVVISDPASVLHLAQHVAHGVPGDALLGVNVIQMVLYELYTGCPVRRIELVGDIPSQRTKLASLLQVRG